MTGIVGKLKCVSKVYEKLLLTSRVTYQPSDQFVTDMGKKATIAAAMEPAE